LLGKTETEAFHSVMAKLLYIATRVRPDIFLAVGFVCTWVATPTKHDQSNLKRLLEYIGGTLTLALTLGADNLNSIQTWVDVSYAVHSDMKSHTGGIISMGRGAVASKSSKQKLNTKSSMEAELVGATDYVSNTIWSKMFLEAQGHQIMSNLFEQNNQSALRLEKNGHLSTGKQSRHINIW
jgi:hypothetical protein